MTLTWNQLINTFFNSYELDIDGFNELAINYYYEPEIYNGEGFYFEIFPEDEDYTYWCKEYDMNPDDQEIIEVENYFYQYYLIDKETADNLKEYTNLTRSSRLILKPL